MQAGSFNWLQRWSHSLSPTFSPIRILEEVTQHFLWQLYLDWRMDLFGWFCFLFNYISTLRILGKIIHKGCRLEMKMLLNCVEFVIFGLLLKTVKVFKLFCPLFGNWWKNYTASPAKQSGLTGAQGLFLRLPKFLKKSFLIKFETLFVTLSFMSQDQPEIVACKCLRRPM